MRMSKCDPRKLRNAPDHVARTVTDNGCPKDAVGPALDVNLHEALGLTLQDGAVVVVKLTQIAIRKSRARGVAGQNSVKIAWPRIVKLPAPQPEFGCEDK